METMESTYIKEQIVTSVLETETTQTKQNFKKKNSCVQNEFKKK